MTAIWDNGRGFVQQKKAAAGSALRAAPGNLKAGFYAGPHGQQQPSQQRSQPSLLHPGQNPDDDIRDFRMWQSSKGGFGTIGTGKYWKDSDDAAKSLGGIGVDFNRQQYNFRDIRPRTNSKKWGGKGRGQQEEEKGSAKSDEGVDMTPVADVDEAKARMGRPAGGQVVGTRRHGLTDVSDVQNASGEIGNGQQKAIGTGARLNFQTQVGGGQGESGSVFGEIGKGQFPAIGSGRNVIEATAREEPKSAASMVGTPSAGSASDAKFNFSDNTPPLYQPPRNMPTSRRGQI